MITNPFWKNTMKHNNQTVCKQSVNMALFKQQHTMNKNDFKPCYLWAARL